MEPLPLDKVGLPARPSYHYWIKELYRTLQGEGRLAGTPMVVVRFAGCNLRCTLRTVGFDCDTDFTGGRLLSGDALLEECRRLGPHTGWLLLTGGEPALQIDPPLLDAAHARHWKLALETNGTHELPPGLDWVCVSPKTAPHTLRVRQCNELKVVCRHGQSLPVLPNLTADHRLISPACQPDGTFLREDIEWCVNLCHENPPWALSLQLHKILGLR